MKLEVKFHFLRWISSCDNHLFPTSMSGTSIIHQVPFINMPMSSYYFLFYKFVCVFQSMNIFLFIYLGVPYCLLKKPYKFPHQRYCIFCSSGPIKMSEIFLNLSASCLFQIGQHASGKMPDSYLWISIFL